MLVSAGATVNATGSTGSTPLLAASQRGHVVVIDALLFGGAKVNLSRASDSYTPLMAGCKNGHIEVVTALLSGRADVNAQMSGARSALTLAQMYSHSNVEALVAARGYQALAKSVDKRVLPSTLGWTTCWF